MFYTLAFVAFVATILIYSFYPRNDGLRTVDMPREKAIVMQMVAEHNAAVEAARVVTYDNATRQNKLAYESWIMADDTLVPTGYYSQFLPADFQRGPGINVELVCVDNATREVALYHDPATDRLYERCGIHTADSNTIIRPDEPNGVWGTTDYLITYMEEENPLQRRAAGELTYLAQHTDEEHLKTYCGYVSDADEHSFGITNTRHPIRITCDDCAPPVGSVACVTRLSVAYCDNKNVMMPVGGTASICE